MSGAIVLHKQDMDDLAELGRALVDSKMFKDVSAVSQAAVKVLAGRELGLGPVESMRAFHIIEGKIEMSADLIASMVKQHPKYDYRVRDLTNESCTIEFIERCDVGDKEGWDPLGTSTFTIEDARQAGIFRGPWVTYPRNMLFARAMSNGVAWLCPDAVGSARIYAEGEVGGSTVEVEGRIVDIATGEIVEDGADARLTDTSGREALDPSLGGSDSRQGKLSGPPSSTSSPASEPISESEPEGGASTESAAPDPESPVPSGAGDANRARPVSHKATKAQKQKLAIIAGNLGWDDDRRHAEAGVASFNDLSTVTASALIEEWSVLEQNVGEGETDRGSPYGEGGSPSEAPLPPDSKMALYGELVNLCHEYRDGRIMVTLTQALNRALKANDVPEKLTEDDLRTAIAFVKKAAA